MKGGGKGTIEMPPDEETGEEPGLSRIWALSRPEWGWLLIGTLFLFGSLLPLLLLPLYFGSVVDDLQNTALSNDQKRHNVSLTLTELILILLGGSFATFFRALIFNGAGERTVARMRVKLFHAVIVQDIAMFDRRKTGELLSRLTSDATSLQDVATTNVSMFLRGLCQILFSAGLMFYNSWKLASLILIVIPLCVASVALYSPVIKRLSTKYTDALGVSNDVAQQSIANIRTVRSFAAEGIESQKYSMAIGNPDNHEDRKCCWYPRSDSAYKAGIQKQIASAFFGSFVTLIFLAAIIAVLWFGAFEVIDGSLSFGNLSSFILYAVQIAGSIGMMTGLASSLYQAKGASKRTFQLIDRQPKVPVSGGIEPSCMQGIIRFENVSFAYPTRPEVMVMQDFTLDIPKDATVAFVGSSGAGKSTILSLIQRFYDVTGGVICIDGQPLTSLDPSWVRRQFAFVQQEPVLFGATIAANIGYGHCVKMGSADEQPSSEQLEAVAKDAYCHDFILGFPEGYQTLVGERGVRLSGGQKQRIAIARALLMNPRVLLLDEATSALDAESESIVARAIERAMVGRTTLIVAHRLSTVQRADQIVLVEHGQLVDKGTHDELLHRCVKYQELVRRQLAGGPNDESAKQDVDWEHTIDVESPPVGSKGKGNGESKGKGASHANDYKSMQIGLLDDS